MLLTPANTVTYQLLWVLLYLHTSLCNHYSDNYYVIINLVILHGTNLQLITIAS